MLAIAVDGEGWGEGESADFSKRQGVSLLLGGKLPAPPACRHVLHLSLTALLTSCPERSPSPRSLPRTAAGSGCGTGTNGFNVTIPAVANTYYYIIVSHTNTAGAPLLKLSVKKT